MNIQYGGGVSTAYQDTQDHCEATDASVYETQKMMLKNLDEAINVLEKRLDDVLSVVPPVAQTEKNYNGLNDTINCGGRLKSQIISNNASIQRCIEHIQTLTGRVDLY